MRNPRGSVGWDGTGWKLCLGVRPLFCGAIHLQGCVWGAWCCYRTVAVGGRSFLSEETGYETVWSTISCAHSAGAELDPLLPEAVLGACVRERQAGPLGPKIVTTRKTSLYSNSHTLEMTHYLWQELKITLILILTWPAFFALFGFW